MEAPSHSVAMEQGQDNVSENSTRGREPERESTEQCATHERGSFRDLVQVSRPERALKNTRRRLSGAGRDRARSIKGED